MPEHVVTEIGEEFWRSTENIRKILRDSDKQLSEAEKEKAKQGEQLVQLELRRKLLGFGFFVGPVFRICQVR